jgi:hypothetical protein
MIAFVLDFIASFFLAKWLRQWWAWMPLALVAGVLISFGASMAIHFMTHDMRAGETMAHAIGASVWHALICVISTAVFRWRLKNKPAVRL